LRRENGIGSAIFMPKFARVPVDSNGPVLGLYNQRFGDNLRKFQSRQK
jgi:hypothetical protein